jgi:hypothetical protein
VNKDSKELKENVARLAFREIRVLLDQRDQLDLLEYQVKGVNVDPQEKLETLERLGHKVKEDLADQADQLEKLVTQDQLVRKDSKEVQDLKDPEDHRDQRVPLEPQALKASVDLMVQVD